MGNWENHSILLLVLVLLLLLQFGERGHGGLLEYEEEEERFFRDRLVVLREINSGEPELAPK